MLSKFFGGSWNCGGGREAVGGKGAQKLPLQVVLHDRSGDFCEGLDQEGRTPTELDKLNDFDEDSGLGEGEAEGKSLIFLRAGKGKLRVTHANALKHNGGRKKNEI